MAAESQRVSVVLHDKEPANTIPYRQFVINHMKQCNKEFTETMHAARGRPACILKRV